MRVPVRNDDHVADLRDDLHGGRGRAPGRAIDASHWAGMTPEVGYGLFQTSGSQPLLEVHQTQ
jgi:hypothetical protein